MAEHPILFSTAMVRAILAGEKTQTRRVVQWPASDDDGARVIADRETGERWPYARRGVNDAPVRCPFGAPGDVLWVRETWRVDDFDDANAIYYADMPDRALAETRGIIRWRPSIHMPRNRARLFLRITDVRVERLHAITPEDIVAEGVRVPVSRDGVVLIEVSGRNSPLEFLDPRATMRTTEDHLRTLWASLWSCTYGRPSWDANPWCWVIGFERVEEVPRG